MALLDMFSTQPNFQPQMNTFQGMPNQGFNMSMPQQQETGGLFGNAGIGFSLDGLMGFLGQIGQLYGMFQSFKMQNKYMDMMEDQLGIAKEQWGMTKDEIARIQQVRDQNNQQYNTGYNPTYSRQQYLSQYNNPPTGA